MVYQWKSGAQYSIPAQKAGEELERITAKYGELKAEEIVEESRPEDATLHVVFEWDDDKAAELYRREQARAMTRQIITVQTSPNGEQISTRAFVHVADDYKPIDKVLEVKEYKEELMDSAARDMMAFEVKYNSLKELTDVFDAIDAVLKGREAS